jgi:hypothetical protein
MPPGWQLERLQKLQMVTPSQLEAWVGGDDKRTKTGWDAESSVTWTWQVPTLHAVWMLIFLVGNNNKKLFGKPSRGFYR